MTPDNLTDDEVIAAARTAGYELEETQWQGRPAWGWRDVDESWQPFTLERRLALNLMRDRLRQVGYDPRTIDKRE